ncbi:MAG: PD40 domain-containing protein [Caldilineales bacterium]|nr:PD40 domain-containing protein [Caldilineales bacterium]
MFPTATPWVPPPPPKQTVTPLPILEAKPVDSDLTFVLFPDMGDGAPSEATRPRYQRIPIDAEGKMVGAARTWELPPDTNFGTGDQWVSPDRSLLASIDGGVVYVIDTRDGALRAFMSYGKYFNWHPNSREILFYQDLTLEPGLTLFNIENDRYRLIAQPKPLDITGAAISPNGQRLAYGTNNPPFPSQIYFANADGSEPRAVVEGGGIVAVWGWSYDGEYLAYMGEPGTGSFKKDTGPPPPESQGSLIWVMDRNASNRQQLKGPFFSGFGFRPMWSPREHKVAYVGSEKLDECWMSDEERRADPLCRFKGVSIYVEDIDSGELWKVSDNALDPAWSPDGAYLAYVAMDATGQVDVWISDVDGQKKRRLTGSSDHKRHPIWLPQLGVEE